jgi:hypothetical protein
MTQMTQMVRRDSHESTKRTKRTGSEHPQMAQIPALRFGVWDLGFGIWSFREAAVWDSGFGACDFPLRAGVVFLEVCLAIRPTVS